MIYYESKSKKSFGNFVICIFLLIIIYILINLINKIEVRPIESVDKITSEVTSYNTNEISLENMINNSMYSIVGVSKMQEKNTINLDNSENIEGMCSGIVVSQDGYVLTSRSIVGGMYSTCFINLINGEEYEAEVIWEDENLDIAVLKTKAIKLPCMSFANIEECFIGQRVYLISNYTGYEIKKSVEEGIISMIDDTVKVDEYYIENVMKIDVEVGLENNGGAVVNENGELIGIALNKDSIIVPISRIIKVIEKIDEDGKCEKIDLGIYGYGTEVMNYLDKTNFEHGVYIEKIDENSLLKNLISEGEIITRIDGIEVRKMSEIKEYAYGKNRGDTIIFSVLRDNIEKDIEIAL